MTHQTEAMAELIELIASDSYAISFQTMGQYRTALLKAGRAAISSQPPAPRELPPLPESEYKLGRQGGPIDPFNGNGYEPDWVLPENAYTADQMREYARASLTATAGSKP